MRYERLSGRERQWASLWLEARLSSAVGASSGCLIFRLDFQEKSFCPGQQEPSVAVTLTHVGRESEGVEGKAARFTCLTAETPLPYTLTVIKYAECQIQPQAAGIGFVCAAASTGRTASTGSGSIQGRYFLHIAWVKSQPEPSQTRPSPSFPFY